MVPAFGLTPGPAIAPAQAQAAEPAWHHALSLFGEVKYPAGFKRFHSALCAQLANIIITVDKSVEEGEWISVVCTLRAKAQQTGIPVTTTGNVMVRIVDGKLIEAYNHWDFLTLFSALGTLPPRTFETALAGRSVV